MAITLEAIKAIIDADITPLKNKAKEAQNIIEKTQDAIRRSVEKTSSSFKKLSTNISGAGGKATSQAGKPGVGGVGLAAGVGASLGAIATRSATAATAVAGSFAKMTKSIFQNFKDIKDLYATIRGSFRTGGLTTGEASIFREIARSQLITELNNVSSLSRSIGGNLKQAGMELKQFGAGITSIGKKITLYILTPIIALSSIALYRAMRLPQFVYLINDFKKAMDNLLLSISSVYFKMLPIERMFQQIILVVRKLTNYINENREMIGKIILYLTIIATVISAIAIVVGTIISIFGSIIVALGSVLLIVGSILSGIAILASFGVTLTAIVIGIGIAFVAILGIIIQSAAIIIDMIVLLDTFKSALINIVKGIPGFLYNIGENFKIFIIDLLKIFISAIAAIQTLNPVITYLIIRKIRNKEYFDFNTKMPEYIREKEKIQEPIEPARLSPAFLKSSSEAYSIIVNASNKQLDRLDDIVINTKKTADGINNIGTVAFD